MLAFVGTALMHIASVLFALLAFASLVWSALLINR